MSSINNDVGPFNADLPGLVHAEIKARLDKLRADADVVAALGVPRRQHHTSSRGDIEPNTSGPADTHGQARVERYRTPGTSEPPSQGTWPHTRRVAGVAPKGLI